MSYVIKDIEKDYWLGIERGVDINCNIVTSVEPIYSYRAATQFADKEDCVEIMKEIQAEGNYDIPAYKIECVEELLEAEKKVKEEQIKKAQEESNKLKNKVIEDLKAQGLSEEDLKKVIETLAKNNTGIVIEEN